MELSSSNLFFLKRKLVSCLGKQKARKISYISANGNPKKLLIFQEVTFRARKIKKPTLKKSLIFQKIELSNSKKLNKTFLYSL